MASKKRVLPDQEKRQEAKVEFLFPCSAECLAHINNLFCIHLFIELSPALKRSLLMGYFISQVKIRSKKLDNLLDLYSDELPKLHAAIIKEDSNITEFWKSMVEIVHRIHAEMKSILLSLQHDEILHDQKIISIQEIFQIQKELKASSFRRNITFLPLGQ
jgi:hypothetical protein